MELNEYLDKLEEELMSTENRLAILSRNTEEIVTKEEAKILLDKKTFPFYYGTAPSGPVHFGYFIPLGKVFDTIKIGGKCTILIADRHAYLDDRKTPWEEMEIRSEYYETCVKFALGKTAEKIKFIRGSSFQTNKYYVDDLFKISGITTVTRAKRAASEVVRMTNPKVSGLMYPLMQTLDIPYLNAELVIGGIDQRHIYMLSRELLPEIGYKKPVCVFTPLITSLKGRGEKMSASIPGTHIKVHDSEEEIAKLIKSAYCPPKETSGNPVVDLAKYIILPLKEKINIERPTKFGGDVTYKDSNKLEKDYKSGDLHPNDLKSGVTKALSEIAKPIRSYFETREDLKRRVMSTYKWNKF